MKVKGGKKQRRMTAFLLSPTSSKGGSATNEPSRCARPRSTFQKCPICFRSFPKHRLSLHASACDGENDDGGNQGGGNSCIVNASDEKMHASAASTARTAINDNEATAPTRDQRQMPDSEMQLAEDTRASRKRVLGDSLSNEEEEEDGNGNDSNSHVNIVQPRPQTQAQTPTTTAMSKPMTMTTLQKRPTMPLRQIEGGDDAVAASTAISITCQSKASDTTTPTPGPSRPLMPPEPISGLFVFEDFITVSEEQQIMNYIDHRDSVPWRLSKINGWSYNKRWGALHNLKERTVRPPKHPLPQFITELLLPRLQRLLCNLPSSAVYAKHHIGNCIPNEANAIDYRRRQGHWLRSHVDDRQLSLEPIANLSLAGDCIMTFRNEAKHRNLEVAERRVHLKRRCLQILTGRARYDFSHEIGNDDLLSDRRVSITMRRSPVTCR